MQKHIFALSGPSDSGKTTTINDACELFGNIKGVEKLFCDPNPKSTEEDFVRGYKINGIHVGFSSGGDWEGAVEYGFKKLKDYEIIVCATRTKGEPIKYIKRYTKNNKYHLFRIHQPVLHAYYEIGNGSADANLDREEYYSKRNEIIVDLILALVNAELNLS